MGYWFWVSDLRTDEGKYVFLEGLRPEIDRLLASGADVHDVSIVVEELDPNTL